MVSLESKLEAAQSVSLMDDIDMHCLQVAKFCRFEYQTQAMNLQLIGTEEQKTSVCSNP